jgi:hypothetical protein
MSTTIHTSALDRVARAARARQRAEQSYRDALAAASSAGASNAAIGRAAGVTKEAIRKMLAAGS